MSRTSLSTATRWSSVIASAWPCVAHTVVTPSRARTAFDRAPLVPVVDDDDVLVDAVRTLF